MSKSDANHWKTLVSFDGTRLTYWLQPGEKPLIVLANGLGGTLSAWHYLIDSLSGEYRFLTWDYRGLYRSGRPKNQQAYSVGDHCRDLEAIIEKCGVKSAIFCGWSMGVQVLLEYYSRNQEKLSAIIALNGTSGSPFSSAFRNERSSLWIPVLFRLVGLYPHLAGKVMNSFLDVGPSFEILKLLGMLALPAKPEDFREFSDAFRGVDLEVYSEIIRLFGKHDVSRVLKDIRCPVLLLAGEKDLFTPREAAEQMAAQIADCRLRIISGGTHYMAIEYPASVHREIDLFLTERLKRGSISSGVQGTGVGESLTSGLS
jgi:pimeloyl-ACP methyl ester carboxylesterase